MRAMIKDYGLDATASAFHAMMEQLPICCLIKDDKLRYRIVNKRFCELLGADDQKMIGRRATELFDADYAETLEARERKVLETGEAISFEEEVECADGVTRHYITRITLISSRGGDRFVCVALSDVTELNAARREAESADRIKSEFLATMSHELRTPMNGVLGLAQILKETDLTSEQRQLVDTISSSGEGLLSVISDILDVTVIEAGQMRLCPARYEVAPLVEDTVRMMTPAAEAAGVRLFLSAAPDAPAFGVGDAARIRQILTNFIGNAVKFTEAGHIEVRCESGAGQRLVLSVSDTGIGVSEDDQAAIFERFRQAKGGVGRSHQGVGLGLSICKALAEMMGGDVGLSSTLGKGSTFTLSCALDLDALHGVKAASSATTSKRFEPMGVAKVVDPYRPRARALAERLANWGWAAPEACAAEAADVVVVVFDGAPGPSEAAAISTQPAGAPIVFVTPLSFSWCDENAAALVADRRFQIISAPAAGGELRAALSRLSAKRPRVPGARRAPPEPRLRAGQS